MPTFDDRSRRYEEILRSIARRRAQEQRAPAQNALAAALDSVNAFGFLEDLQAARYRQILCYGPKAVAGDVWSGVVVWHRPRGYYAYRTLTLLGIWAYGEADGVALTVGEKALAFSGQYFNAESYNKHIKTRFDIYYNGDASPPAEAERCYSTRCDPARRLAIRQEIQDVLAQWMSRYR